MSTLQKNLYLSKSIFKIFLLFSFLFTSFLYADNEPNNNCLNVEIISEVDHTFATTSHTESGTAINTTDPYDYYKFTVDADGYVDINFYGNKTWNSLFIGSSCSGSEYYSNIGNSNWKNPPEFMVNSGDTIYVLIERRHSTTMAYDLYIDFTLMLEVPPVMSSIPNQTSNPDVAFNFDISNYVTLTNGDPIISYTLSGDTLPAELDFNTTSGVISGTPTSVASYSLSVTATDNDGESNSESFTLEIEPFITNDTERDFTQRAQYNLFGDVRVVGNTVLCLHDGFGECTESALNVANNDVDLQKAPRSSTTLDLPVGSTIEYARLYWSGRIAEGLFWDATSMSDAAKIQFKKSTDALYTEISADTIDFHRVSTRPIYAASADVFNFVDNNGTYEVDTASFYTLTGNTPDTLGASGAWVLVVIYSDPNETKARNINVFDGYKIVTGIEPHKNVNVTVNGFLTPKNGSVDSTVYAFAAEGDKYILGDKLLMAGVINNTTSKILKINGTNDNSTFNSRIDTDGTRDPNLINNNGIDIHKYNVGTDNGQNIIKNDETGATFTFTSDGDHYWPSLLIFSTELYLPQLCYDYSIKQDGHFLDVDRAAYPIAQLDSTVSSSDLDITVYIKNLEADIPAQGLSIRSDVNVTRFNQIGNIYTSNINGSALVDRGVPTSSGTLCEYDKDGNNLTTNNGCTDGHNIRKGNGDLDNNEYVYTKFTLKPNNTSGLVNIDEPLGLSLKYYITASGNKIEYPEYVLGGINVPLCSPSVTYQPEWGYFNVVQSGQVGDIKNNLYTQVSRNPFNASVIFDSSPETGNNEAPTSDINTTVLVEIVDMDSFGDINASCSNPDSVISEPIFVPIGFDNSNYQVPIAPQVADYYSFATKNAAFRIWYFNDANGTLIQNWNATTSNNNKTLVSISGLYDVNTHTQCSASCSDNTSTTCYDCIKDNYAKALCSRDNFAIRPESYDLGIYDINQSLAINDPLKNTSKVDISTQDGFNPESAVTTNRMNLSAGYDYRFDLSATGHDGNINQIFGYTRYFNGGSDFNASLLWDPQTVNTGCNNTDTNKLSFYVANGIMQNNESNISEIGEYKLKIIDKTWTAVDWQLITHHDTSSSGGFLSGEDCIVDSSITTSGASPLKHGCTITTDHGSDGGALFYQDHDIEFHPYKFDMSNVIPSHGVNYNANFDGNTSIYMSLINSADTPLNPNTRDMAFHLDGTIRAVGFNGTVLSNFVDNCYAESLELSINKTLADSTTAFYRYDYNTTDTVNSQYQNGALNTVLLPPPNTERAFFNIQTDDFNKSNSGSNTIRLSFNFDRNVTGVQNPENINFTTYDSACTTPANCQMNADLSTIETKGSRDLNQTLTTTNRIQLRHYYGRSHASRQRYQGNTGTANIFYEVYCFGTISGNTCNKTLLQDGNPSLRTDDLRWYINTQHSANEGTAGTVREKNANNVGVAGDTNGTHPDTSTLMTYNADQGYPYKTTMDANASRWLIHNENNINATMNEFQVEFESADGNWSGAHDVNMNTTTKSTNVPNTNRRSMW